MQMTASQWSTLLGGKLEGNPDVAVTHPARIEEAGAGAISFIAHPKYLDFAYTTRASVLIVGNDIKFAQPVRSTMIRTEQPYLSFTAVLEHFNKPFSGLKGIDHAAFVSDSAEIADDVYVGAFAYLGKNVQIGKGVKIFPQVFVGDDVVIGEGSIIYPGVKIYREGKIGANCIIHSGVIIGSDGFGFAPTSDGHYEKIPQLGNVIIEDDVEVGANTTIDRSTMGSTIIRKGVKLDNLVHIAHNVEVGEHTVIAAQSGISGSTRIGKHCRIGGQVGLVGHLVIADGTQINAQSGVSKSILEKNQAVTGSPAFEYRASLRSQAVFRILPQIKKQIENLEARLKELEQANAITK